MDGRSDRQRVRRRPELDVSHSTDHRLVLFGRCSPFNYSHLVPDGVGDRIYPMQRNRSTPDILPFYRRYIGSVKNLRRNKLPSFFVLFHPGHRPKMDNLVAVNIAEHRRLALAADHQQVIRLAGQPQALEQSA